jgi:glycosyltransferase involved in cell wall biosynthesis
MKIVYVSSVPRGGPISYLLDVAPRVAAAGHSVHALCGFERVAEAFRSRGIDASAMPLRHKLDLIGAARLSRRLDADVVHTHDRRTGLLVRPAARARGASVVHTLHGLPEEIAVSVGRPETVRSPGVSAARLAWLTHGYLRVEAGLARLGPVVIPSSALKHFLVTHGFPAHLLHVIHSGVEVRRLEPRLGNGPLVIGTVTNLVYWKGVDVLLAACAQVGPPLRLEIFGAGADQQELERQAAELGVEACFHGFVDNVTSRLDELDLFVLPSRTENLPIAVLEAMANALPVVATRVGGVPELVVDGETGILIEPGDPRQLAAAIQELALSPERRQALGRAGARRAAEHFDAERAVQQLVSLYEEIRRG